MKRIKDPQGECLPASLPLLSYSLSLLNIHPIHGPLSAFSKQDSYPSNTRPTPLPKIITFPYIPHAPKSSKDITSPFEMRLRSMLTKTLHLLINLQKPKADCTPPLVRSSSPAFYITVAVILFLAFRVVTSDWLGGD